MCIVRSDNRTIQGGPSLCEKQANSTELILSVGIQWYNSWAHELIDESEHSYSMTRMVDSLETFWKT